MSENELTSGDFTEQNEPFTLFAAWLREAETTEPNDPNAVALATVDKDGLPNVRMVLLKGFDSDGFVFYTNFESAKGRSQAAASQKGPLFEQDKKTSETRFGSWALRR